MVNDIERELHLLGKTEIESSVIGEMAIERLKELDSVAYIRYASVYRDFQDEESFAREIEALGSDSASGGGRSQLRLIPDNVPRLADRGRKRRKAPAS
jgi:transcriptional repressor NrdR